ncbi:Allophanate hydrolase subunit 1 [Rubrobacter radiotolerans]|uniref:Allophanate hydrolase subunit 1 n=1 Tax=Rubrobacter radiotolerans TaxID=42256 RepID=A0A023X159_RUBRA|nr:carboxyltransferase domain-containing protein [Rubrobacter radiotolerans]AHY46202.1 Allophanate hydrolase subunit 1 [Rubrobacter radiotolerans]MDX5893611.1 carboxyltransferase domain-containing protein [Rubrobacter radiotolerans]SMC04117.1 urea carboxylase [Rubrobacter radiotolerans DSM 5868]
MSGGDLAEPRYSYGGDEYVFVELAEGMSLQVNFRAMAITNRLKEERLEGITDICPSNASYMVRLDPDVLHPDDLISRLKEIDAEVGDASGFELETRVVDVPVMMEDPWTHEALMRFRDRHQDPNATDLEYSARINGYKNKDDFIAALMGSPWLVTMIGFVPGLPWCYQLVPPEEQVEVPKYVRPRTFTPKHAFGFGGGFAVVYSVQGAGGYQLYGIAAAPVLDVKQRLKDFRDSIVFPKPGDIFNYRNVDREEFDRITEEVEAGTFEYRIRPFTFNPERSLADPHAYNKEILGVLYGD